jgi:osmotically-inducible protein OsmY
MKRHQHDPLADGDYTRPNLNRERAEGWHDRYVARDDHRHQQEAQERNRKKDRPRESSFYGNIPQQQGHEYEKEAGYRERFRKIGEGYQQKSQQQAWPRYQENQRGKGPRNYQRSDDRILEDVQQSLTDHPSLDASDIVVKVENSEVMLTGTVETRQAKRLAEDICESVRGVSHVENRIRVQHAIGNGVSIGNP